MAGPSILVRVLGDVKAFGASMDGAGAKAASAASKAHAGFSTLLSGLNQTGVLGPFGAALATVDASIGQVLEHGKKIAPALAGVGGALLGVGAGLSALGSKDQAAHQQLQAAVEATGGSYETYAKQVEAAIKHQENFGHSAAQTQDALTALTEATHDPAKAIALLGTASDVAAAKHEDLSTAATAVGKVYNGNTKLLKEFGITIDKTTKKTTDGKTATQALADVTSGQAAAAMNTFAGRLDVVKTKIEDMAATFGQKYGPAIQAVGAAMMAAAALMQIAGPIMAAAEAIGLGPILLIAAAVAALIVIGYLLYKNWDTIWAGIKKVISVVWDWIKGNWPLLLGILIGPVGLAAALIYKYWDQIKAAFAAGYRAIVAAAQSVISWLARNWPLIVAILTGPIGLAVLAIERNFGTIVSFFAGIPGQITGALSTVFDVVTAPFGQAVDAIVGFFEGLPSRVLSAIGNLGGDIVNAITKNIPGGGVVGKAIGAIGGIFQEGGLVPGAGPMLAVLHGGEYVLSHRMLADLSTPGAASSSSPVRSGPAVHIENVHLSDEVDIEAFMRRAAWVAQTQRV